MLDWDPPRCLEQPGQLSSRVRMGRNISPRSNPEPFLVTVTLLHLSGPSFPYFETFHSGMWSFPHSFASVPWKQGHLTLYLPGNEEQWGGG